MTAEEFERRYHFKPSDMVLKNMNNPQEFPKGRDWVARHCNPTDDKSESSYHCIVSRSGKNLTYEFCNKKLQDDISNQSFIFDIDGQLIYIDMEKK